mmetsp:Transcript_59825/g.151516  ORF Transcript_59825/g.151516 Transcript_59825/m.151516 type:complete len:250 (-) Transcript_59825:88-837(-)
MLQRAVSLLEVHDMCQRRQLHCQKPLHRLVSSLALNHATARQLATDPHGATVHDTQLDQDLVIRSPEPQRRHHLNTLNLASFVQHDSAFAFLHLFCELVILALPNPRKPCLPESNDSDDLPRRNGQEGQYLGEASARDLVIRRPRFPRWLCCENPLVEYGGISLKNIGDRSPALQNFLQLLHIDRHDLARYESLGTAHMRPTSPQGSLTDPISLLNVVLIEVRLGYLQSLLILRVLQSTRCDDVRCFRL